VKTVTLKGDDIAGEFQRIVEGYVQHKYSPARSASTSGREPVETGG
jgi:hypothetical protein